MTDMDRHDRTWRFMQTAFPWSRWPDVDALNDIASGMEISVSVGRDLASTQQGCLAALAVCNIVGRLPVALRVFAPDLPTRHPLPAPYSGDTLLAAVHQLGTHLGDPLQVDAVDEDPGFAVQVDTSSESSRWHLATRGWMAYMGATPSSWADRFNPPAAYLLGCMLGGEVLRAWARETATRRAGDPGPSFAGRARPAVDRWINLWTPDTAMDGPDVDAFRLPPIDWAGAGAVTQAALAVLAATPGWAAEGRVIDPKLLDLPDLNRSLLSFRHDVGQSKARITAARAGGQRILSTRGRYPHDVDPMREGWIVAGTDDVRVRSEIQLLWPRRLVVTATEDVFGYVAWHAPKRSDMACAGCAPTDGMEPEDRIPTSAPTSAAAGVMTAATLLRLAAGCHVAARTDILTMRLDVDHALEESDPLPEPGCPTCATRRAAS